MKEIDRLDGEAEPQYNIVSEKLRRCTPSALQCSVFCGGRLCRYETPESWDSTHIAIRGIYSHWITDDIVAMARPCTEIIHKRNVIRQFHSLGVRSLVNLQEPGEHNNCGCPLEPSGFTYEPTIFMENSIYYYNYAWPDYGEVRVVWLLDMIKTMSHALSEGKVAVHCHAGLGRTGVLVACFLVYSMRFRANDAIKFVRIKRPNSVQSRVQILCVQAFERLLLKQPKIPEITLPHYILTQKIMLHGYEARCIKYIPKIMYVVCERLLELCACKPIATIPANHHAPTTLRFFTALQNPHHYHYISNVSDNNEALNTSEGEPGNESEEVKTTNKEIPGYLEEESEVRFTCHDVVEAMIVDPEDMTDFQRRSIFQYQMSLNHGESAWRCLKSECRLVVLAGLLTDWLEQLKSPVIDCELLCQIVIHTDNPMQCLMKFEFVTRYTIEYLFRFVAHLVPIDSNDLTTVVQRLIVALTHQSVIIRDTLLPKEKEFGKLRKGTYNKIMEFSMNLLDEIRKQTSTDIVK